MPFIDLPPQLQERVICSISAAVKYEVPANIVLAVAEKEGGKPGQWVKNTNGTHDVGPMQFNTLYLGDLAKYGITANDVAAAGCYSFDLAAWRLRQHIRMDKGDLWTRAANYHSRTPPIQRGLSRRLDAQGCQVGRLARCAVRHPRRDKARRNPFDSGSRSSGRSDRASGIEAGPCSGPAGSACRALEHCQLRASKAHHQRPVRPFF